MMATHVFVWVAVVAAALSHTHLRGDRREVLLSSIARMHCTCEWLQRGAVRSHHDTRQVASRTKINRSLRSQNPSLAQISHTAIADW